MTQKRDVIILFLIKRKQMYARLYRTQFLQAHVADRHLPRRVVYNAQLNGYRVCVLNHIGTLATVPVTSPRIFMSV